MFFLHKIQQHTDTCLSSETETEAELWRFLVWVLFCFLNGIDYFKGRYVLIRMAQQNLSSSWSSLECIMKQCGKKDALCVHSLPKGHEVKMNLCAC